VPKNEETKPNAKEAGKEAAMAPKVGYLLPTRESVMQGRPAAGPLLMKLAELAEELRYDSIWIGDSLLDRPRHEPLVMLAGVAGRTKRMLLGTGVRAPKQS
jgi:alkanesulfonate monooxygenase SsuD/methylene tetrahydromethanopterin reductase-like flavin-dependent oxidoreductase (luciferase family)